MGQDTEMSGEGECQILPSVNCRPHFYQPYYGTSPDLATFNVTIDNVVATGGYICSLDYTVTKSVVHRCNTNTVGGCNGPTLSNGGCSSGFVAVGGICTRSDQFQSRCAEPTYYDDYSCTCPDGTTTSPIIIDVGGLGYDLTNAENGVLFDILAEQFTMQRISWTLAASSNAFLVLDRNGNSVIDTGEELFGNITPQPASADPNGFRALAVYDTLAQGGNNDGSITGSDSIYSQLRLWQDFNHNGLSEQTELSSLNSLGVATISLDYKLSRRTDEYGNEFRYRAKITNAQGIQNGRWAWDVFLVLKQD